MKRSRVLEGWLENDNRPVSVDILCPVYNHEPYLRAALDGMLMQETAFPFRIIIHDDASTDGSAEIIREYQEKYPEKIIAVIEKENLYQQGHSIWMKMYPYYTSKYLATCEGDDFWTDKHKLQKQVDYLEKHADCSAVYHNILPVDEFGKPNESLRGGYPMLHEGDYSRKELREFILKTQTASLVRRNYFPWMNKEDKSFYASAKCNGDEKMLILLGLLGRVHYLPDVMAAHRIVRDKGDSWSARQSRLSEADRFLQAHKRYLEKCRLYEYFSGGKIYRFNRILDDQFTLRRKYPEKKDRLSKSVPLYAYIVYLPFFLLRAARKAKRMIVEGLTGKTA